MAYQSRRPIKCLICGRRAVARRLCRRHYSQAQKRGRLGEYAILGPEDVFESKFEKSDGCWLWQGTKNGFGYGIFLLPGEVPVRAHRYAYERVNGPIPDGLVVMHTCDVPACVRPDHLVIGTRDDNNRDMREKRRNKIGESHHWTKLSDDQVREIVECLANKSESQASLARRFGIHQSTVSNYKTGKRRPYVLEIQ